MNVTRILAILKASNYEFFRDKGLLGWNLLFPFLIVVGFGLIFGGGNRPDYKVGVFPYTAENVIQAELNLPEEFKNEASIEFIAFPNFEIGLDKLNHHKIDMLVNLKSEEFQYWVSSSSPKGYIVEKLYYSSLIPQNMKQLGKKQVIQGKEIRYIDFLFPGILAMNMMFSALFGVGYIIVRYRKNGVLKRLKATPLTALEYLTAQTISRLIILTFMVVIIWIGCDLIFSFNVEGSYFDLVIVFLTGGFSLISLGVIVASRGTNEELTSGILNFLTWPMMFLSEVWFSIEGAPQWLKMFANIFPLTHLLRAARKIMNDGQRLFDVIPEISILLIMTAVFLAIGASLFSWRK
ncbi:MAG: ABC transporter permease [Thermodesulfobacteriota bacterium]|nr:ABC transporter permease [Thermodesulfobacteriota bacterium]